MISDFSPISNLRIEKKDTIHWRCRQVKKWGKDQFLQFLNMSFESDSFFLFSVKGFRCILSKQLRVICSSLARVKLYHFPLVNTWWILLCLLNCFRLLPSIILLLYQFQHCSIRHIALLRVSNRFWWDCIQNYWNIKWCLWHGWLFSIFYNYKLT